jgi:hypothetical protein
VKFLPFTQQNKIAFYDKYSQTMYNISTTIYKTGNPLNQFIHRFGTCVSIEKGHSQWSLLAKMELG